MHETQPIRYADEPTATMPAARHLDGTPCRVGGPARTRRRRTGEPGRAGTIALIVAVLILLAAVLAVGNLT